jgi:CRP/FNR family cyclic AMP-dependent transcriptional regulator
MHHSLTALTESKIYLLSVRAIMSVAGRISPEKCSDCQYRGLRTFCNLGALALRRFEEIGSPVSLPGRAVLFRESQLCNAVFVVCTGQLKLTTTSKDGRTLILRLAVPGDVLGLSATLGDMPYEVTAETVEPTILRSIRKPDFLSFLAAFSEVGEKTSTSLAREYHAVYLDARRLALSGSAAGRLAQLLFDWATTAACGKPDLRFTMALTHEELASMAGTSRETVTRLLNQFERDHLITRRGTSITIVNPSSLAELAL